MVQNQYTAEFLVRHDYLDCPVEGEYTLRPDRRYLWLQKLCLWVLKKLGANRVTRRAEFETIYIHTHKLMDFIRMIQIQAARSGEKQPHRILIGWRTFTEFIDSEEARNFLCHSVELNIPVRHQWSKYKKMECCGIDLYCVPWYADGVVVLPSEKF